MRTRFLFFFLLCFFIKTSVFYGQESLIKIYEAKYNGNNLRLQTIILDAHGNLICGTDQGVMVFDGAVFSPAFVHDSSSTQQVQSLFIDTKEQIWVGYKNGKIGIIDHGQFSWFNFKQTQVNVPVTSFAEDEDHGRMFFSTLGEGIYILQNDVLKQIDSKIGLSDDYCYKILKLKDKRICAGTDQGLNFIEFENEKINIRTIATEHGLPDNIVRDLSLENDNTLLVGLQDKGYCSVDLSTGKIKLPAHPKPWSGGQVNCLLSLEGTVLIGTETNGIYQVEESGNILSITSEYEELTRSNIRSMISDPARYVWMSTGNKLIRSTGEKWKQLRNEKAVSFSFVHSIFSDNQDNVWFSPDQQLYKASMGSNGKYQFKKFNITPVNKLIDIVTIRQDSQNFIWIGTLGEGVFVLDPQTGKVSHPGDHAVLNKGNIMAIEQIEDRILIGGFGGLHSFKMNFDANKKEYKLVAEKSELSDELHNNYIYSIHTDKKGRTWLGTDEQGLLLYDKNKIKFLTVEDGLSSMTILSITSDNLGRIWMATQGGGISMYDGTKFENYSVQEGLTDPSPSSVIIDKHNRVLAIHTNGVDIFDPDSKTFQYYSSESGLGDINPDLNSVSTGTDGKIWIGTERGIFIYTPSEESDWQQPTVQINSILLFLEPIKDMTRMVFKHDQNNISIEFSAPWFTDPNRISYSYQLDGFSAKWLITKDQSVSYPRLPPGKYHFRVRASLNNKFEQSSEASYVFEIKAPFWQLLWFRIFLALIIFALIWFVMRRREMRLRKTEKQEKEKIEFRFETLRSQVNPHFLFNSFNTLITVIEKDPPLAIEYVEHLSQFFRNIIGYKDIELIPLSEEIGLLENFVFIQSKRYGKHLQLNIKIEKDLKDKCFIPPLTLQLLAENAIKHNSISHESPLLIELFKKGNYLIMTNNINPKYSQEASTGIGLQNIKNRYKILSEKEVIIVNDNKHFTVSVPIIKESQS